MNPVFFMPTKIICEKNAIIKYGDELCCLGKIALIITGKKSSKLNGALDDVLSILNQKNINYYIFDDVEENPSTSTISKIIELNKNNNIDFVIGVGGGSSIDASKAASILLANPSMNVIDLFSIDNFKSIPVVAIPTTAGTGSETTQYSILTNHSVKNKVSIKAKVFPKIAFLDASYLMNTPQFITINTAVDALSHLIEGYLSTNCNLFSDSLAESGIKIFSECIKHLVDSEISFKVREKLLCASAIAGIVIAQSGTSLPHGMGYPLTYYHNIPHGMANGILLKEYLKNYNSNDSIKISKILSLLGFKTLDEFGNYIEELLSNKVKVSISELEEYSNYMISNEAKLKNHPFKITYDDILNIYKNSLLI